MEVIVMTEAKGAIVGSCDSTNALRAVSESIQRRYWSIIGMDTGT